MISLPLNQVGEEEGNFTSERNNCKVGGICVNLLEDDILGHSKDAEQVFITEYLLVASVFGEENWAERYCWVHIQLKVTHKSLTNQIKIEQAVKHIKWKYFDSSINTLKGLINRKPKLGILL